ncbi:putative quinol monooxygenase [Sphingomonas sp. Sphisp140]|uniref:putative quinol monooxygenase n=1 Tax=unclassified Sphingomonas TaxID=196159 RepID=UPI0039AF4F5B
MSMADGPIVLINRFDMAPEHQARVLALLTEVTEQIVRHAPGFLGATLHRSLDGQSVTMVARWESQAAYQAMRADPRPLPWFQQALEVSTFTLGMYEAVEEFRPA